MQLCQPRTLRLAPPMLRPRAEVLIAQAGGHILGVCFLQCLSCPGLRGRLQSEIRWSLRGLHLVASIERLDQDSSRWRNAVALYRAIRPVHVGYRAQEQNSLRAIFTLASPREYALVGVVLLRLFDVINSRIDMQRLCGLHNL